MFPDDWTAAESTMRLGDASASLRSLVFQTDPEEIEPLPPPPIDLVPVERVPLVMPWVFLLSTALTLAVLWCACAIR